jgi:hypothetical protein
LVIPSESAEMMQSGPVSRTDILENTILSMREIGRKMWAIAEGYIPGKSTGPAPEMSSHEAICFLNASDNDAHVAVEIFFSDREPVGPYKFTVPARRTKHVRLNNFTDPEEIPRDTEYSSFIESDVPVVVQHTRLDSRQAANALLSTIAFPCD